MNIPASTLANIKSSGREKFEQLVKLPGSEMLLEAMGIPAADAKALAGMSPEKAWATVAELSNKALGGAADGSAAGQQAVVAFAGASPSSTGPLQVRMGAEVRDARDRLLDRGEKLGLGRQSGMHALQAVTLMRLAAKQISADDATQLFRDAAREMVAGTHATQDAPDIATVGGIRALALDAGLPSPAGFATPAAYRDALLEAALAASPERGAHVGAALFSLVTDTRSISNGRWAREVAGLPDEAALATLNARAAALGVGNNRATPVHIQADIIHAIALKQGDLKQLEALFVDCAAQSRPGAPMNVPAASGLLSVFGAAGVPLPSAQDTPATYRATLLEAAKAFDPATGPKATAQMLRDAAFLTNVVDAEVWRLGSTPRDS